MKETINEATKSKVLEEVLKVVAKRVPFYPTSFSTRHGRVEINLMPLLFTRGIVARESIFWSKHKTIHFLETNHSRGRVYMKL